MVPISLFNIPTHIQSHLFPFGIACDLDDQGCFPV